jgi:hypothetical protein
LLVRAEAHSASVESLAALEVIYKDMRAAEQVNRVFRGLPETSQAVVAVLRRRVARAAGEIQLDYNLAQMEPILQAEMPS